MERFDINTVVVSGEVSKIRPFGAEYILIHLLAGESRINLAIPGASTEFPTLMTGDLVAAAGWLENVEYQETLHGFLKRADKISWLDDYPPLGEMSSRKITRVLTAVRPVEISIAEDASPQNTATIEGMIARLWQYSNHYFARLAVYDENCVVIGDGANGKLPRRRAHYVTVQFANSQVDGRTIEFKSSRAKPKPGVLRPKDRIRVSGHLSNRNYAENLSNWLGRAKSMDALKKKEMPDPTRAVVRYGQVVVVADGLLQYS